MEKDREQLNKDHNGEVVVPNSANSEADAKAAKQMKAKRDAMLRKQAEERKAQEQRKKMFVVIGAAIVAFILIVVLMVSCGNNAEQPANPQNPTPGVSEEVKPGTDTENTGDAEDKDSADKEDLENAENSENSENKENSEEKVDNHVHNYVETITEPTHLKDGFTTFTCKDCKDEYIDQVVKAEGHKYEVTVIKPTCTEKGYSVYECKCGDKYTDNELKAAGHKYVEILTKPTCTKAGHTTYECTVCGYSFVDDKVQKLEHDYEQEIVKPTYTAEGYTKNTCTLCGDSYKSNFKDALEKEEDKDTNGKEEHKHDYVATVTKPTCTKDGYTTYKCSCGDKYTDDTTNMLGHDYKTTLVDPDCKNGGYQLHECSRCKDSYKTHEIDPMGHDYKAEPITAATCTSQGEDKMVCVRCSDTYNQTVDKLGHDYQATVVEATCEEAGYTSYGCSRCFDSYVDDKSIVPALGHDYKIEVTDPTITENGKLVLTCGCGETVEVPTAPYDEIWAYEGQDFEGECPKFTEETPGVHYHTNTHFINGDYVLHYCSAVKEVSVEGGIIYLPFPNFCPDENGENVGIKHEHEHVVKTEGEETWIYCTWISKEIFVPEGNVRYLPYDTYVENPVIPGEGEEPTTPGESEGSGEAGGENPPAGEPDDDEDPSASDMCITDDDEHNHVALIQDEIVYVYCDKCTEPYETMLYGKKFEFYPFDRCGYENEDAFRASIEDANGEEWVVEFCQADDENHKHREYELRPGEFYVFCDKVECQKVVSDGIYNGVKYNLITFAPWDYVGVLTEIEVDVMHGEYDEAPVDSAEIEGLCLEADSEHKHIAFLKDGDESVFVFCEKNTEVKVIKHGEQKIILCPFELCHCENEDGLRAAMEWYNTHIVNVNEDINYNEWTLAADDNGESNDDTTGENPDGEGEDDNDEAVEDYDPSEDAAICEADDDTHNHIETVDGEFTYIFCEKVEEVQVIEDVKYMPWKYLGFENEDAYYDSLKKDEPEIVNEEESVEEETPTETEPSQEPAPTE